ncbi:MAG: hypothetical protein MJ239_01990 [Bacilli bacterium]|nr:hypothetical protein [Bacilli bacterium]
MKSNAIKKYRKLLLLAPLTILVACGQGGGNTSAISSQQTVESTSVTNPVIIELKSASQEPVELVAPFTIYTPDGETPVLTTDKTGQKTSNIPTQYDNLYAAIRVAGSNATSKNALQVQDANNVQVFKRAKVSQCYVFDGDKYVGTSGQSTAKAYCTAHPTAYAVNGNASDYYYLGRHDMVEGQSVKEDVLETNAGAYNYMFSKGGSGGKDYGYRYATADVHLSETTYRVGEDESTWNAYIFINMHEHILSDLGLIGTLRGNEVRWYLVRNCSSAMHTAGTSSIEHDAKFFVYQDTTKYPNCIVTKSTKYDATTKTYSGFDDLHFEAFTQNDGWTLNITNLRTGVVSTIEDHHTQDGHALEENTSPNTGRALIAASYCPVIGNIWNWDSGAALNNVVWDNISLKKAIVDDSGVINNDIEAYRNETVSYPLYPGEDAYRDGYSQGGYKASHEFGTRQEGGEYKSGIKYTAGQKYLSFSVDYGK